LAILFDDPLNQLDGTFNSIGGRINMDETLIGFELQSSKRSIDKQTVL